MTSNLLPVVAGGVLPGQVPYTKMHVGYGATIEEIVQKAFPILHDAQNRVRVHIVGDKGEWLIEAGQWSAVRPKLGTSIVVKAVPGRDQVRSVLTVVVSVAAIALTGPVAGLLGVSATGIVGGLVTAGLTVAGTLLVNALIPVQFPNQRGSASEARRNVFSIQGWRNDARPGENLPSIYGQIRYAPPFAASSYTEIVDDQQFVRALFTPGYGPVAISDLRIGDTPIEEFEDVEVEIREGRVGDQPVTLFPRQVLEEAAGIQLVRPFPRDGAGEIISGADSVSTPVTRFTARDAAEASVILSFPQGLFRVNDDGDVRSHSVTVRIRQRLEGVGAWTDVETLEISSDKREAIFRQHSWALPTRGRWQIEVERMSDEPTETNRSDTVVMSALQSIRPEYPINTEIHIPLIAVRVRATYQLNGTLDNLNAMFRREMPTYSQAGGWEPGVGSNPASAYRAALQGAENPFPADDTEIDEEQIADWYDYCVFKGLKFDHVQDEGVPLGELLAAICSAGRATPRHDGLKWGVVVDRPDLPVIEHVNDRNADQFNWSRPYLDPPDGFRVSFFDASADYALAERIVSWPGFVGDPVLTEEIALPGKTDPDEIWRECRRRMYELIYRSTNYSAMTSMRSRVATRGDKVMTSFRELQEASLSARVRELQGNLVVLDDEVSPGSALAIRFKVLASNQDDLDLSVVRSIADIPSATTAIRMTGDGELPTVGQVVQIGPVAQDSIAMRVLGIEGAADFDSRLIMIEDAPIIDELTDAEIPPAWDGRVGQDFGELAGPPGVPIFKNITDLSDAFGGANFVVPLYILVAPGGGSSAPVLSYQIDHRLAGNSSWTSETVSVASAFVSTNAYELEDDVQIRARAIGAGGESDFTDVIDYTIGSSAPDIPSALAESSIDVTVQSNGVRTVVVVSNDTSLVLPDRLQVFRAQNGVSLDRDTDAVSGPISVSPGQTFQYTDSTVPAGTFDYYVEPQNTQGVAGPISGPFNVTVT